MSDSRAGGTAVLEPSVVPGGEAPDVSPRLVEQHPTSSPIDLGWLPTLSLVGALGLLIVALADSTARDGAEWAGGLFWVGLLTLFVPIAARLLAAGAQRTERIGLVAVLSVGLYLVKILHSPLEFTFYDEFAHWRTVADVARTGRLFQWNSLLMVSPFYPGLASITDALTDLSGTTIFGAGVVILAVARLVLGLALFLFYEQVVASARLAGTAALLYMANPNFVFFDSQFSYESISLPFAALTLYAVARRAPRQGLARLGLTVVLLLGLGAVVITHHLSSYAVATFLVGWTAAAIVARKFQWGGANPGWTAALALVAALGWLVYVATLTVDYLAPVLANAVGALIRLIAGEESGRQLFRGATGQVAPAWEQLVGFASVGFILLILPFGLNQGWRRYRTRPLVLVLLVGALAYPSSLALRLTHAGAETSNRASEFVFVPLAFVLALGLLESPLLRRPGWRRLLLFTVWATVIFMGGVIVGWAPWARLPGPYLVIADPRSIEPQGVSAARWARRTLGSGNRVAADRINRQLMGSYGEQVMVTGFSEEGNHVAPIFLSRTFGETERSMIRQAQLQYMVVDDRMSDSLPFIGEYFEQGESGEVRRSTIIDPEAIAKFDQVKGMSRIFDSGDIRIYDVTRLSEWSGAVADAP